MSNATKILELISGLRAEIAALTEKMKCGHPRAYWAIKPIPDFVLGNAAIWHCIVCAAGKNPRCGGRRKSVPTGGQMERKIPLHPHQSEKMPFSPSSPPAITRPTPCGKRGGRKQLGGITSLKNETPTV